MKEKKPDYFLLATFLALISLGILVLAGISAPFSQEKFGYTTYYLFHQIKFGLLPGIFLAFLFYKIPLSSLKKWSFAFLLSAIVFLGLVFVPHIGISSGGASRWLNLGLFSFQPSEFLKISFIIYLSAWLSKKEVHKNFIPFLIIISSISLFLIEQPDVSTLGIIVFVAILMYFSVGTPSWHTLVMIFSSLAALAVLVKIAPYRFNRVLVLLKPDIDPMGIGYQIKQSLIAIGSGGLFGLGLGMSNQKFDFIPQTMSDSIFSIYAEETGFFGSIILISLFIFLFLQGYKLFRRTDDRFSQLLILGICSWITFQAIIHIGAMIAVFPLTGIPLPFISYGGSHLIAEMAGAGLLLNISRK